MKTTVQNSIPVENPPVKSYGFLLQQGIQANDVEKVEKAIRACCRDRQSAYETAKDLDASKVVPFLQMCNKVFRAGPTSSRKTTYLRDLKYWIDFLEVTMHAHASFLSSVSVFLVVFEVLVYQKVVFDVLGEQKRV